MVEGGLGGGNAGHAVGIDALREHREREDTGHAGN